MQSYKIIYKLKILQIVQLKKYLFTRSLVKVFYSEILIIY